MVLFSRFFPFLRPYLPQLIASALMIMGVAALNLVLLRLAGYLWDVITIQHDTQRMTQILVVFLMLVLGQSVLSMGHSYLSSRVAQSIMSDFRIHIFSHLQKLSLSFFARRRTGELLSRLMNDVTVIQTTLTETPIDSTKHLVTLVGGIGFLLVMNWRLCLLIVVLLPILVLIARLFGKRLKALSVRIQDQTASLSTLLEEVISGIRIVKSFVQTPREEQRFGGALHALMTFNLQKAAVLAIFVPTITLLTIAMAAVVLSYGGQQVIQGTMSPGDLFAFVLFAGILIGPFGSGARVFAQIKEAQGAMQKVLEIMDTQPEVGELPDAINLPSIRGHVCFDRVTFAYDPRQIVLSSLSFEIHPGEMVALVGQTGSGKTTIANLLHRFYDPINGTISIDAYDLRQVRIESLYRQIALVPQETILFGGTIWENIRYGRESATDEEVIAASQAANSHDFILSFPDGYQTIVGEKGLTLSGGQRQRIAIARAILKNPRILILDEATSALDSESELLVQEALERLMVGRTTVVIAHRMTTIQQANRILVLNRGRIVEGGSHRELMTKAGLYHQLYTLRLADVEGNPSSSTAEEG